MRSIAKPPVCTRPGMLAVAVCAGVMAATADAAQGERAAEEIIVTGSRIENPDSVSAGPVTRVDAGEIVFQGATRVEDMLRNLPQVYSNQNTGQSNSATGTATINLRNLGDARTLVLVNGRRLPAGSPVQGGIGADINQIPGALLRSVEVLTGGASAAYGSDAVAGVVNFQMLDDFDGVKLDYQFSRYYHDNDDDSVQAIVDDAGYPFADGGRSDGDTDDFAFIAGNNFDDGRGNVTGYVTYREVDAVTQSERDYSSCALNGAATECVGSGTIPEGRITNFLDPDENEDAFDYKVMGGQFVPRDGTLYNFGPLNYFQRPDERHTAGLFAHYEMSELAEVYTELMYADTQSVAQIAPSGAFFVTDELHCGNPLLSDQQFEQLCGRFGLTEDDVQTAFLGRRNVEGGPRRHDLRHESLRGVLGLRGGGEDDAWRYDLYGMYGEVRHENTFLNDLSITNIRRALDVTEDGNGNSVCQSVVDGSDPDCVPWNIFETGAVTQEQTDYLTAPLSARGSTEQTVYSGYIAGDLGVALPSAKRGVELVLGTEYRKERLDFKPNEGFRNGDGAGQGGATRPVSGGYDVKELFIETGIPLAEDAAFAEALSLDAGYRYSSYSTGHNTDTYGIRGGWSVNDSIRLRAGNQRAIRVANIRELFQPQGFNLFDMEADPCGGPDGNGDGMLDGSGRTFEECMRSGVTRDQFGGIPQSPASQYNFLQGGNAELEPEESDTWSLGVVLTPRFAPGLTLSVDYYDIEIEKGIDTLNPEIILNQCLDGNAAQCRKIRRSERTGDLWVGSDINDSGHIISFFDNVVIERVKGFDIIATYRLELDNGGSLDFHNITGLIDTWDRQELAEAPAVDCKGNWGDICGYPTPELQNNLRITWRTPWDVSASVMWRYIDAIDDLNDAEIDLDSVDYFDLAGVWNVSDSVTLTAGVTNLFDQAPPIAGANAGPSNNGNGNIFPGMYDALGRYWFARVSIRL